MNARRVWAVARKEFLHVLRDARSLAMAILMPILMLLLFGYALYIRDPVFILGQGFGVFVYLRNLYFIKREKQAGAAA